MEKPHPSSSEPVLALLMILLLVAPSSSATVCVEEKLKPLRHIRGILVDPDGRPIPSTKVEILKDEKSLTAVSTKEDGKFSFENLAAGTYRIRAEASGFVPASYHVVLIRPKVSDKRILQMRLHVGGLEWCSDIQIIKAK